MSGTRASAGATVDAALPGGNARIIAWDGVGLELEPELRGHGEPWFWWCFRITDPGPLLRVRFRRPNCLGPLGPACSTDGGATWTWLGAGICHGDGFAWEVPAGCRTAILAMAPPYTLRDWQMFAGSRPWLAHGELCRSINGRSVPCVHAGDAGAPLAILLTARHHACESSASRVLEGILDGWHDQPVLRSATRLLIVPLVDLDGVEQGDAGKARLPHDHNRDYRPQPVHPETAAIQRLVPAWCGGRLACAIDLHSPWIRGAWNEHVCAIGSPDPAQQAWSAALMAAIPTDAADGLPMGPHRLLPHGTAWNTDRSGTWCRDFAARLGALAATIEIPYAGVRRDGLDDLDDPMALTACDPLRLRAFGRHLAHALAATLPIPAPRGPA